MKKSFISPDRKVETGHHRRPGGSMEKDGNKSAGIRKRLMAAALVLALAVQAGMPQSVPADAVRTEDEAEASAETEQTEAFSPAEMGETAEVPAAAAEQTESASFIGAGESETAGTGARQTEGLFHFPKQAEPSETGTESAGDSVRPAADETEQETQETESAAALEQALPDETETEYEYDLSGMTETAGETEQPAAAALPETAQGSTPVNVTVQLDFRRLPSSTVRFLMNSKSNPIKYYTVEIRDCATNETVFPSSAVRRKAGADGIMSLAPVTFTAKWDMGKPDPVTGRYPDLKKTYAVTVSLPHFRQPEARYVTLTVHQTEEPQTPSQSEEPDPQTASQTEKTEPQTPAQTEKKDPQEPVQTEDPESRTPVQTEKTDSQTPSQETGESAEQETQVPVFTWQLTGDAPSAEQSPDTTLTFVPQVDVDTSPLTTVSVTNLTRISRPRGTALEGGTITPGYILSSFLKPSGTNANPLVLLDRGSYQILRTQLADADLGHANDMTYVASRNEIYTTPVKSGDVYQIIVFDASTLKVKRRIPVDRYYGAISYDETNDFFFLVSRSNSSQDAAVYSGDFTRKISSFHIPSNLTYQGCGTWNGLLYYTAYEHGSPSSYEPVPDGRFRAGDTVIWIYDRYGNLLKTYYIPASGDGTHHEVEAIMFDGGRMILQFNENGRVGYYMVDPEPAYVNLAASVSVANGYPSDGRFQAGLYLGGKRIAAQANRGGAFTFPSVRIEQPGSYIYQILEDRGKETYLVYSGSPVTIAVTATYDPFTNQLTVSSWYQGSSSIRNYQFTKKEKKKLKKLRKSKTSVKTLKPGKKKLTVKFRKVAYAGGYEVQICRNRKFRGKTLRTRLVKKPKAALGGLKRRKKYYVRIRPYRTARGITYYGKYSSVRSVRIR